MNDDFWDDGGMLEFELLEYLTAPEDPLPDNVILMPIYCELRNMEFERNGYHQEGCICMLYDFATRQQIDILLPEDYYE